MMHICVSKLIIIGLDNGLLPSHRQTIIWTNAGILLIWPFRNKIQWNINRDIYIFIQENEFQYVACEMLTILSQASMCILKCYPSRAGPVYIQAWQSFITVVANVLPLMMLDFEQVQCQMAYIYIHKHVYTRKANPMTMPLNIYGPISSIELEIEWIGQEVVTLQYLISLDGWKKGWMGTISLSPLLFFGKVGVWFNQFSMNFSWIYHNATAPVSLIFLDVILCTPPNQPHLHLHLSWISFHLDSINQSQSSFHLPGDGQLSVVY